MTVPENIRTLVRNPAMQRAFAKWTLSRILKRGGPRVVLHEGAYLGSWSSFSEYWTFHGGVPVAERRLIANTFRALQNAIAFDVGANVGAFTCLLPTLGAAEVHAFEPVPETFCRLRANVTANHLTNCCHLNCLAVGRSNDLVTFRIDAKASATNRLFVPGKTKVPPACSLQTIAAVTLDSYCESQGINRIDFLKIDVEGMEPAVLEGAANLLAQRRVGVALLEVCPVNLRSAGLDTDTLFRTIQATGYNACELLDDGHVGARLTYNEIESIELANVVLMPRP